MTTMMTTIMLQQMQVSISRTQLNQQQKNLVRIWRRKRPERSAASIEAAETEVKVITFQAVNARANNKAATSIASVLEQNERVVGSVTARTWNNAEVEALKADVNVGAFQTPIADVPCSLSARITVVSGI